MSYMDEWGLDDVDLSAPEKPKFDPIPKDTKVIAVLSDCKINTTKTGTDIVNMSFKVVGDDHKGRYLNHSIFCNDLSNLPKGDEWKKEGFVRECNTLGVFQLVKASEQLSDVAENIITGLAPQIDKKKYQLTIWGYRTYEDKNGNEVTQERFNIKASTESDVHPGVTNHASPPKIDEHEELGF